jgi:hypothetical protein
MILHTFWRKREIFRKYEEIINSTVQIWDNIKQQNWQYHRENFLQQIKNPEDKTKEERVEERVKICSFVKKYTEL